MSRLREAVGDALRNGIITQTDAETLKKEWR